MNLDNLQISKVTEDVLLVHQIKIPSNFSCSDGLLILPKEGRNSKAIALDINIEPEHINAVVREFGPVSDYVNTHGHMDHIAHVHNWEQAGATIHAPSPESMCLTDIKHFFQSFDWRGVKDFSSIEQFAMLNKFKECENVVPFMPGDKLMFENCIIETISFSGHSQSHVGFFLPLEKILHVSCLGFDQPAPGVDGFGPWYGFKQCSIEQYIKDIDHAESIFLEKSNFLTSSHAHIVKNPDTGPFKYMRNKIIKNQQIVDQALKTLDPHLSIEEKVYELLKNDLFFPKSKMKGFLHELYALWESHTIKHHVERSETLIN